MIRLIINLASKKMTKVQWYLNGSRVRLQIKRMGGWIFRIQLLNSVRQFARICRINRMPHIIAGAENIVRMQYIYPTLKILIKFLYVVNWPTMVKAWAWRILVGSCGNSCWGPVNAGFAKNLELRMALNAQLPFSAARVVHPWKFGKISHG